MRELYTEFSAHISRYRARWLSMNGINYRHNDYGAVSRKDVPAQV